LAKKRSAKAKKETLDPEVKADRVRTRKVVAKLKEIFPEAECSLTFENPLQLLIATILSAQCTDERVNMVTAELFKVYKTAENFADAPVEDLEEMIHSTGFFRNKAKNIKACCGKLVALYGGVVPESMDDLVALDGVGRKTANVVMGNAFGIASGVVVDTHVGRISRRLALTENQDPVKVEKDLGDRVAKKDWVMFSHLLIRHGRATCTARSPDCPSCEIGKWCPSRDVA
jgi:endonuclease-3